MMNKTKKFQLPDVLTISAAHMVHDIYSCFLAPILPLLIAKLGISLSMAGFLSVISRLPSLLNPAIGLLADKMSVRYFIILTPSVTAVAMSLLGAAPNYIILSILLLVMGVSATLFHVPTPVLIKQFSGDRIGKGMSFYMVGGELARSIGPVVILAAVSWWGLEGTYRLIPFGLLASLVLYYRIGETKIADAPGKSRQKSSIKLAITQVLPFFVIVLGIMVFRGFMQAALTTFLPTFLKISKGKSLWVSGLSLSIIQLAGAAGTFFCGTISDKIGRRNMLIIISIVSPLLMWVFLLSTGIFTIPLLIILGFSIMAPTPVLLAMVQELESDRPAFNNSIFMSINFIASAITVMLVGMMGDWVGLENAFRISAVLAIGAIPFILKIKEEKKSA